MNKDNVPILELSTSGIYTLILFLPNKIDLKIGKLGKTSFPMGYYTYTGSALGKGATSLRHRIARHLRKKKRKFWHIDYLIANENTSMEAIIVAETNKDLECTINNQIKNVSGAKIHVNGFGASDCRKNCESHLLYFPEVKKADFLGQRLIGLYQSSPAVLSVCLIE